MAGDHDDGSGDLAGLQFAQQIDAAGVGQPDIHDEEIEAAAIGKGAHLGGGTRDIDLITLAFEDHPQGTADIFFVVNDQNAPRWHGVYRLG